MIPMKRFRKYTVGSIMGIVALLSSSCNDWLDINVDPDRILEAPIAEQLTSLTVAAGFASGSDLNRYTALIMQQYSGQSNGPETQTQQAEKYQISPTDQNNAFSLLYATILNSAENIIRQAGSESPHYSGVAKLIKAYYFQVAVDIWGDLPYSETQQMVDNLNPAYEDDASIYSNLITLIDEGLAEINASSSVFSPGTNSQIYPGDFATSRDKWIKFANTLKLRLFLHYSEVDAAFATQQINTLINSGATFFEGNSDNFLVNFLATSGGQSPIHQFEVSRAGYLVANNTIVSLMNSKADPRRAFYFTDFPAGSGEYVGSIGGAPNSQNYSKFHTYLRGPLGGTGYTGQAPVRMLTFAEYNFIRAEAALRFGSPGNAQEFFTAGIRASLTDAGVSEANIAAYLGANGTLSGTSSEQLKQIIEEKYVANFGVIVEPWTDWRRTGYPEIQRPSNAIFDYIPRSLFYPQSEDDNNNSFPGQKPGMDVRVFWDVRQ